MEFYLTMDKKRRFAVPTKCRKILGTTLIVSRGLDKCLNVYASKVWESGKTKAQELDRRLSISAKHRKLSRFLTTVEEIAVDGSGRVLVPEHLAQFADLKDTIVFVSTEEGFQIWSSQEWENEGMPDLHEAQMLAEGEEFQKLSD
ncbi:MAG: hypothetical protein OXB96_00375 [Candidatus Kaiserbacteria bacterium]|nr:hypothetical protein [Candidatus Kaiserbacteria bacterium]